MFSSLFVGFLEHKAEPLRGSADIGNIVRRLALIVGIA